ncbi:NHL repeat-containing protein [Streptomyces anulatus]|uniref:hypothetical protein n=1 Tax=Streptomyces anulatus TaxID=1892 RepID=UPI00365EEB87
MSTKDDQWVAAVNHPLDSGPCRLVFGRGAEVERVLTLALETARSIAGLAWKSDGDVVLADNYLHVCRALAGDGTARWSFGSERCPGRDDTLLSSPSDCVVTGRHILILNEMSGTITVLDNAGRLQETLRRGLPGLSALPLTPTGGTALTDSLTVLTDAHSGLLHSLRRDSTGWHCRTLTTDQQASLVGQLSFPRGLAARRRTLFVADTAHERIAAISIDDGGLIDTLHIGGWPRALTVTERGLLVADGLGSRIVRVDLADAEDETKGGPAGNRTVLAGSQISELPLTDLTGAPVHLRDPHHLAAAGAGRYWLVDSDLDDVLLLDSEGRVHLRWSTSPAGSRFRLADPHQVLPVGDALLVVDTNNHRILRADALLQDVTVVRDRLTRPRFIVSHRDGWLVSDHSGTLAAFDENWDSQGAYAIRPAGWEHSVHLDDPLRALISHEGSVYATDWERGLVYRIS